MHLYYDGYAPLYAIPNDDHRIVLHDPSTGEVCKIFAWATARDFSERKMRNMFVPIAAPSGGSPDVVPTAGLDEEIVMLTKPLETLWAKLEDVEVLQWMG